MISDLLRSFAHMLAYLGMTVFLGWLYAPEEWLA